MKETKSFKDLEKYNKPREKLIREGFESLTDYELLAIILSTGTKDKNVIDLSKEILEIFSYEELLEIEVNELINIRGIREAKATRLVAGLQLGKRINERVLDKKIEKISSSKDVYDIMSPRLSNLKKEYFYAILLDSKNVIIAKELISIGDLSSTVVNPREVFKPAIKKSAKSIILVHNHPSGNPKPSTEDFLITDRLVEAGDILDIEVLDHVVIGNSSYFSFKKEGNL